MLSTYLNKIQVLHNTFTHIFYTFQMKLNFIVPKFRTGTKSETQFTYSFVEV